MDMEDGDRDSSSAFPGLTQRPPIDIEQLAKQHFDNMIRAKLVTLEPTAEAMLPDAPLSSVSPQPPTAAAILNKQVSPGGAGDPAAAEGSTGTNITGNGNQTIYTCDQCDKTFTKKSSITRHKYEHSGMFCMKITHLLKFMFSKKAKNYFYFVF